MGSGNRPLKKSTRSQVQVLKTKQTSPPALTRAAKKVKTVEPVSKGRKMTKSPTKEKPSSDEPKKQVKTPVDEVVLPKRSPRKNAENKPSEDPIETDDSESKFKCKFCQRGFKRKYDMEKHCRKHTGDKPYKCGICGKQVVLS